jgi:hypothetical protein
MRARRDDHDVVAFRDHRHDLLAELRGDRLGLDLEHLREERDHAGAPRLGVRVVLDVALGEPLVGELPVSRLEQVALDVIRRLLVPVELRVGAGEQRLGVRRADDGFLGAAGARRERGAEEGEQRERLIWRLRWSNRFVNRRARPNDASSGASVVDDVSRARSVLGSTYPPAHLLAAPPTGSARRTSRSGSPALNAPATARSIAA